MRHMLVALASHGAPAAVGVLALETARSLSLVSPLGTRQRASASVGALSIDGESARMNPRLSRDRPYRDNLSPAPSGAFLFGSQTCRTSPLTSGRCFGIDSGTGVCALGNPRQAHMPGDPDECRERSKRCWALATQTKNPVLQSSLVDLAEHGHFLPLNWPRREGFWTCWTEKLPTKRQADGHDRSDARAIC